MMLFFESTYLGDTSSAWWFDLTVSVRGPDGSSYGHHSDDFCGAFPDSLHDAEDSFTGDTVTGADCISVPTGQRRQIPGLT